MKNYKQFDTHLLWIAMFRVIQDTSWFVLFLFICLFICLLSRKHCSIKEDKYGNHKFNRNVHAFSWEIWTLFPLRWDCMHHVLLTTKRLWFMIALVFVLCFAFVCLFVCFVLFFCLFLLFFFLLLLLRVCLFCFVLFLFLFLFIFFFFSSSSCSFGSLAT